MKTYVEGSYFGESEILKNCSRMFTVRAQTALELLELSREDFVRLLEKFPETKKRILYQVIMRSFNEKMAFIKNDRLSWIPKDSQFWHVSRENSVSDSSQESGSEGKTSHRSDNFSIKTMREKLHISDKESIKSAISKRLA